LSSLKAGFLHCRDKLSSHCDIDLFVGWTRREPLVLKNHVFGYIDVADFILERLRSARWGQISGYGDIAASGLGLMPASWVSEEAALADGFNRVNQFMVARSPRTHVRTKGNRPNVAWNAIGPPTPTKRPTANTIQKGCTPMCLSNLCDAAVAKT
jgi:hypothetical protein